MFEPTNEQGVIVLFAQQAQQAGFEVVEIGTQYPDAIIRKDGETYKAEFEYQSSNFFSHNHDPSECDLIICYTHDWSDCPLPVIELKNPNWTQSDLHKDIYKLADWWRARALSFEASLIIANKRIHNLEKAADYQQNLKKARETKRDIIERRREQLSDLLQNRPELTNQELADQLGVSVGTIKADKRSLNVHSNGQDGGQ